MTPYMIDGILMDHPTPLFAMDSAPAPVLAADDAPAVLAPGDMDIEFEEDDQS
jgi:hypothetical protein